MSSFDSKLFRLTVSDEDSGLRLDQYLALRCDGVSRTLVRKVIDLGGVHLEGRRVRKNSLVVSAGEKLELYLDGGPTSPFRLSQDDILFQDSYLIGLNKPAGVATQPTPARYKGTLYEALTIYLPVGRNQRKPGIGMVQRLDRDTSGVIIFSTHTKAHKKLTDAFRDKTVGKKYLALVSGEVSEKQGEITSDLARRRSTNLMVSVAKGGKYAETHYRLVESFGCASLLEVEIPTGRSHQIRVHFSESGHPLLGDDAYGGPKDVGGIQVGRQMLHAHELFLEHPVTGEDMTLRAELPEDFQRVLRQLRSARG